MITYKFKCNTCNEYRFEKIQTWDITKNLGIVDKDQLEIRTKEVSLCKKCNNISTSIIDQNIDTYLFDACNGKGKISQRYQ